MGQPGTLEYNTQGNKQPEVEKQMAPLQVTKLPMTVISASQKAEAEGSQAHPRLRSRMVSNHSLPSHPSKDPLLDQTIVRFLDLFLALALYSLAKSSFNIGPAESLGKNPPLECLTRDLNFHQVLSDV